jgi:hypothetical protein
MRGSRPSAGGERDETITRLNGRRVYASVYQARRYANHYRPRKAAGLWQRLRGTTPQAEPLYTLDDSPGGDTDSMADSLTACTISSSISRPYASLACVKFESGPRYCIDR